MQSDGGKKSKGPALAPLASFVMEHLSAASEGPDKLNAMKEGATKPLPAFPKPANVLVRNSAPLMIQKEKNNDDFSTTPAFPARNTHRAHFVLFFYRLLSMPLSYHNFHHHHHPALSVSPINPNHRLLHQTTKNITQPITLCTNQPTNQGG